VAKCNLCGRDASGRCPNGGLVSECIEAQGFGGSELHMWDEYEAPDLEPGCDRGGHRDRSEALDTRSGASHKEHWKRVGKEAYGG